MKLLNEKMQLAVEGAGFKAHAEQLRDQLTQQGRQIESWVNFEFMSRKVDSHMESCDDSGSLID